MGNQYTDELLYKHEWMPFKKYIAITVIRSKKMNRSQQQKNKDKKAVHRKRKGLAWNSSRESWEAAQHSGKGFKVPESYTITTVTLAAT